MVIFKLVGISIHFEFVTLLYQILSLNSLHGLYASLHARARPSCTCTPLTSTLTLHPPFEKSGYGPDKFLKDIVLSLSIRNPPSPMTGLACTVLAESRGRSRGGGGARYTLYLWGFGSMPPPPPQTLCGIFHVPRQ